MVTSLGDFVRRAELGRAAQQRATGPEGDDARMPRRTTKSSANTIEPEGQCERYV